MRNQTAVPCKNDHMPCRSAQKPLGSQSPWIVFSNIFDTDHIFHIIIIWVKSDHFIVVCPSTPQNLSSTCRRSTKSGSHKINWFHRIVIGEMRVPTFQKLGFAELIGLKIRRSAIYRRRNVICFNGKNKSVFCFVFSNSGTYFFVIFRVGFGAWSFTS